MLTISEETKKSFLKEGAHKEVYIEIPDLNITLKNDDIIFESLEINESLENNNSLSFMGCIASTLQFKCVDFNADARGKFIKVSVQTSTKETVYLFRGYVDSQTNLTHEDILCEITAYDSLYMVNNRDMSEWYLGLSFPIGLRAFRNSFFNYFGITQKATTLRFDDILIEKTIEPQEISGYEIISRICQLNAVFGRINRYGEFEYVELKEIQAGLYPSNTLYPRDDLYPIDDSKLNNITRNYYHSVSYEDFRVDKIDKVVIRQDEDDIGASAGTGTNAFIIEDNFLVYGKDATALDSIAKTLLAYVKKIDYMPCKVNCTAYPWLECGDNVQLGTNKTFVYSYIMSRRLTGIQVMSDEYESVGTKLRDTTSNTVQSQIIQLKGKTNRLVRDVDKTSSELSKFETDTEGNFTAMSTTITQTAESIRSDAAKTYETKTDANTSYTSLNSSITQTAKQIKSTVASATKTYDTTGKTIDIYGYGTPDSQGYEAKNYSNKYYLDQKTGDYYYSNGIIWSKRGTLTSIEEALKSSITQTDSQIRLDVSNTYETKGDASSEYKKLSSSIKQTADSITQTVAGSIQTYDTTGYDIAVKGFGYPWNYEESKDASKYDGRYYLAQENGDVYLSQSGGWHWNAKLQTQVSKVNGKVELKLDKDGDNGLVSVFNAQVNQFTVNSDNFKLTKDGKITATAADISGKITSGEGSIGGWSLHPWWLYSNSGSTGVGMISNNSKDFSNIAIWAGSPTTSWKGTNNPFYVTYDGKLHAENAEISGYTSTTDFEAATARIGTIEAGYITAETVSATYATITSLEAVDGKFGSLNADNITSGTLSSDRIAASTIKAKLAVCTNVQISDTGLKIGNVNAAWHFLKDVGPNEYVLTGYYE